MTELIPSGGDFDAERVIALLGLNPRDPKTQAMVAVCQRYAFDPLLKHVVVIPQGGVYITRDGLLHAAHRSGQFDGMVLESGPDLVDGEWRCVVSVYRKDMGHPFTFPGRYSATGGNRKYAPEMAIKVAECMALRRAFDVSGLGVLEEAEVGNGPAPAPRPVQRIDRTPADDPWQTPVADVTDAEVVGETPAEVGGGQAPTLAGRNHRDPDETGPFRANPDGPPTQAQTRMMFGLLKGADGKARPREESLAIIAGIVEREIESSSDLTKAEVSRVIDALQKAGAA